MEEKKAPKNRCFSELFLTLNDLFDLHNVAQIDRFGCTALFDEYCAVGDFLDGACVLVAVEGEDDTFFFDKSLCEFKHFLILQFFIEYFL